MGLERLESLERETDNSFTGLHHSAKGYLLAKLGRQEDAQASFGAAMQCADSMNHRIAIQQLADRWIEKSKNLPAQASGHDVKI